MPKIELYELAPTRSARVRWVVKEAQLTYTSLGNQVETSGSDAVSKFTRWANCPLRESMASLCLNLPP